MSFRDLVLLGLLGLLAVLPASVAASGAAPGTCYSPEDNGFSYRGLMDFASSGRKCINWMDQDEVSLTAPGIGSHSYCRNPDESFDEPWCFVVGAGRDDLRREQCNVKVCDEELRDFEEEAEALKTYMGSRDCDCPPSLFFGQLGTPSERRGLLRKKKAAGGAALEDSGDLSPENSTAAAGLPGGWSGSRVLTPVFLNRVEGMLRTCQAERRKRREPAAGKNGGEKNAADENPRRCGLSEVLRPHCKCALPWRDEEAMEEAGVFAARTTTFSGQSSSFSVATAGAKKKDQGRIGVASGKNATMTTGKGKRGGYNPSCDDDPDCVDTSDFNPSCDTACYSTACSTCSICTAVCQRGPYPYCAMEGPEEEQWWYAHCGAASHIDLKAGKKQCGDGPPTGCPAR